MLSWLPGSPRLQILEKTGKTASAGPAPATPAGDAELLFAARERVHTKGWMLREGVGELLLYLATRSVRFGVIASPRTTPAEFNSFMEQLKTQSIDVRAAISPSAMLEDGVEAGVAKARVDLGAEKSSAVLVVGASEPILRAATAFEMFTARYHPPNTMREGVIQTFTVRHIDEVRGLRSDLSYLRL